MNVLIFQAVAVIMAMKAECRFRTPLNIAVNRVRTIDMSTIASIRTTVVSAGALVEKIAIVVVAGALNIGIQKVIHIFTPPMKKLTPPPTPPPLALKSPITSTSNSTPTQNSLPPMKILFMPAKF